MFCCKCHNDIAHCVCPDIAERLASLANASRVAIRFCKTCGEHADRCKCADGPVTGLSVGQGIPRNDPEETSR